MHMRTGLLIALGIIIGSTFSTFIAMAWTAPTANPPGANVASPVNVGNVTQIKNGTFGVNGLGVFGDTILSGSGTDGNPPAYLNFGSTAGTNGYGIRNNNGTLEFRNLNSSWGSLNVTLTNLMTVNGITANGLGQITSIKFGDGTTQTTASGANPWSTNGTSIYYNGGNVGIGISAPAVSLHVYSTANTVSGPTGWGTNIQVETPGTGAYQQSQVDLITKGDQKLLGTTATNLGWAMFARGNAYGVSGEVPNSFGISYWNGSAWVGNNYFRILQNGNIGIGTQSPAAKLHLYSTSVGAGNDPISGVPIGILGNIWLFPNDGRRPYRHPWLYFPRRWQ